MVNTPHEIPHVFFTRPLTVAVHNKAPLHFAFSPIERVPNIYTVPFCLVMKPFPRFQRLPLNFPHAYIAILGDKRYCFRLQVVCPEK